MLMRKFGSLPIGISPFSHFKLESSGVDETGLNTVNLDTAIYTPSKFGNGRNCIAGGNLKYNPSDSFNLLNDGTGVGGERSFTINTWIKWNSHTSNKRIFQREDTNAANFRFWTYLGNLEIILFGISGGSYRILYPTSNFTTGVWYMITVTYDGSVTSAGIKIAVNGVNVTTTTISSGTYGTHSKFNGPFPELGNTASTAHPDAIIDEFSLFNVALTSEQKLALYNSGSGLIYPFTL